MNDLIRKIFVHNWGLKLFSFLLALILWMTLVPEEKIFTEKTLSVPLEMYNIPANMEVVEKPQTSVDVTVRAPRRIIGQITQVTVHAVLDLQNATVNQENFPLSKNMISIPAGAEVKEVYPSQVQLRLEMTKEILLDVEPNFTGKVPEGYVLSQYDVIPPKVMVRGPESRLKEIYKLSTEPIDLTDRIQSEELQVDLILPSPDIRLPDQTSVTIRLMILEKENGAESSQVLPEGKRKQGKKPTRTI